ncbi:MAG: MarR family transcriptional regulator [Halanaerobiales bacterium]|nr:MarR family transcriptional regulator [Halanaerobiales bacterium]
MSVTSLQQEILLDLLHEVNKGFEEHMRKVFMEYNFTISTMLIIGQIKRNPGIIISEIARRASIAKSHVSKTIVELSQQGWVEKRPDPSDQRILRIYLTETAIEQMQQIRMKVRQEIGSVVAGLSDNRVEEMIEGLKEIKASLMQIKEKERE